MTPEVRENVLQNKIRLLARDLYMARCFAQQDEQRPVWSSLSKDQKLIRFAEMQTLVRGDKP